MCFHTNGDHYHHGVLEPSDYVRSVPLGAKRRKGRPKNLPNCLANSPIHVRLPSNSPAAVVDDEAPLRKTTRKRKRMEVEPVHSVLRQRAGLGAPKPPKKIERQAPVVCIFDSNICALGLAMMGLAF